MTKAHLFWHEGSVPRPGDRAVCGFVAPDRPLRPTNPENVCAHCKRIAPDEVERHLRTIKVDGGGRDE